MEIIDLTTYAVIVLTRSLHFPARVAADFYSAQPVRIRDLERSRLEARGLAAAFGVVPPAAPGAAGIVWIFSDTAYPRFGETVEALCLWTRTRLWSASRLGW